MTLPSNEQHVTYQLQYRKCGKASCSTCRNGQGHGPYWYAYWREGTRLRSGYVGKINPHIISEPSQDDAASTHRSTESSLKEQTHKSESYCPHSGIESLTAAQVIA